MHGPRPGRDEILIVSANLAAPSGDALGLLDDSERARAERFLFDEDRRRFVASHAALRVALGNATERDPRSLRFVTGPHGKPSLAEPASGIQFNLSHSGARALIAIAVGRRVGVDIERDRGVDELALASRFFSEAEAAAIAGTPPANRRAAFFRIWTRKEAFVKAIGDGLTHPLASFHVNGADDNSLDQSLVACADRSAIARWRVVPLAADDGYTAALAAEAGAWRVRRLNN